MIDYKIDFNNNEIKLSPNVFYFRSDEYNRDNNTGAITDLATNTPTKLSFINYYQVLENDDKNVHEWNGDTFALPTISWSSKIWATPDTITGEKTGDTLLAHKNRDKWYWEATTMQAPSYNTLGTLEPSQYIDIELTLSTTLTTKDIYPEIIIDGTVYDKGHTKFTLFMDRCHYIVIKWKVQTWPPSSLSSLMTDSELDNVKIVEDVYETFRITDGR